jgi:lipase
LGYFSGVAGETSPTLLAVEELAIPVPGGALAALALGPAGAPPVLAVHGITANACAWGPVAHALAGEARLIACDLRGRGDSSTLPAPYGSAAYVADLLALLDHIGLERALVTGHSLGGYVISRLAVEHPGRVARLLLVDGGLTLPGAESVEDPQAFIEAFLGPALARLRMTFASADDCVRWWQQHPALQGSDVDPQALRAYVERDLGAGEPGALRSAVREEAVGADAEEITGIGGWARRLTRPARLLCAERGLLGEPSPMQPLELARGWAAEGPQRSAELVAGTNHYTLTLGARGAAHVAGAIRQELAAASR